MSIIAAVNKDIRAEILPAQTIWWLGVDLRKAVHST